MIHECNLERTQNGCMCKVLLALAIGLHFRSCASCPHQLKPNNKSIASEQSTLDATLSKHHCCLKNATPLLPAQSTTATVNKCPQATSPITCPFLALLAASDSIALRRASAMVRF